MAAGTSPRTALARKTGTRAGAGRKAAARARRAGGASDKAMRLAGVGSEAVARATGRAWAEWLKVLDRAGAKAMAHKEIALVLSRKFSVPDWWCQMVTVGYEQARGLRAPHQTAEGFRAYASRTVAVERAKLYAAWSEPRQRARWLPEAPLEVRRSTEPRSMRMTWKPGASSVEAVFLAKGAGRSMVQVRHGKLPNAAAATRRKKYWTEALDRLKALLEA